ncbi:alpha-E domain-containing protein [Acetobacter sp. TBRC 12305]|uniref:Alpha-E domain-containing protein n=1 Tax=Acetobacter garciniae TaxID=2817435 RepID=A0A939KQT1_9PROT|nr:alpha-E domain-containing protein [Acetobacter garciniae]MBO1325797.1 alpha-E domain-containing protein [Acetobacter garciniae]MBX0345697.1 alpha-E domain-containing protein [Acetobacter garciniae]
MTDFTFNSLLSRYAECIMWLARYMERMENLARLLEVTETFVRDGEGQTAWDSIISINSDEELFTQLHPANDPADAVSFYITEHANPGSIVSMAVAIRDNARAVRPLVSTEMWTHLNVFTRWLLDLDAGRAKLNNLSAVCTHIRQECQTHYGIAEGTLYHDQAWLFYRLGKHLERCDQITRLVDIRYHMLLPREERPGSEIDITQWTSVLRSAAAYHAFRRLRPVAVTPSNIVGFLLKNESFPRSLAGNLRLVDETLTFLANHAGLRDLCAPLQECLDELRATLSDQTAEDIISRGLHDYMNWIQRQLTQIQAAIATTFWPQPPVGAHGAQLQRQE